VADQSNCFEQIVIDPFRTGYAESRQMHYLHNKPQPIAEARHKHVNHR